LPNDVRITANQIGAGEHGILLIPKGLILGLIVAVIVSPANASERTNPGHYFTAKGKRFVVNESWGGREELLKQLLAT
jgi:hypothetical protein